MTHLTTSRELIGTEPKEKRLQIIYSAKNTLKKRALAYLCCIHKLFAASVQSGSCVKSTYFQSKISNKQSTSLSLLAASVKSTSIPKTSNCPAFPSTRRRASHALISETNGNRGEI